MPEAAARDDTQDWLLGDDEKPPLFSELVERVDEAVRIAQESEEAVGAVGEAAIAAAARARDALQQATQAAESARRSAELAEQAGATAVDAHASAAAAKTEPAVAAFGRSPDAWPGRGGAEKRASANPQAPSRPGQAPPSDPALRKFSDRADRLVARLRALQRIPLSGRDRGQVP